MVTTSLKTCSDKAASVRKHPCHNQALLAQLFMTSAYDFKCLLQAPHLACLVPVHGCRDEEGQVGRGNMHDVDSGDTAGMPKDAKPASSSPAEHHDGKRQGMLP